MKKFWKFIGEDNKSLTDTYMKIEYKVGETITIKDCDMNKVQCSNGIHCLDFTAEKYEYRNILPGPKVAILEVEDEDVVYYQENGKCRVRKAKVLEIKEPEDWMKHGNKNEEWAYSYALDVIQGHDENNYNVILNGENLMWASYYASEILRKHDEKIYNAILKSKNPDVAWDYVSFSLKGKHDEKIYDLLIESKDLDNLLYYAEYILGHDEKIYDLVIKDQNPSRLFDYAINVLKRHDEKIYNLLLKIKNFYYIKEYERIFKEEINK